MQGVIAAGHPQTAAAGAELLQQGGNAVDAAAAATFASFITESSLVNIGGAGVAQVYVPDTGQAVIYDFFSCMPGLGPERDVSSRELDFRQVLVDFGAAVQPFYIGRGSVAVPGAVAGLCKMVEEMGTLPLRKILAPTIRMAREGVVLNEAQAYTTHLLRPILTDTPSIAAIYEPRGQFVETGQTLFYVDLATTLERLAEEGATLFYTGSVAQEIIVDQQNWGGLLSPTDLTSYRVLRVAPIRVNYRGYPVLLPPPSSGGGVLIAFALKLLATVPVSHLSHNGFEHIRILTEVMRLTSQARAKWEQQLDRDQDWGEPASHGPSSTLQLLAEENIRTYTDQLHQVLSSNAVQQQAGSVKSPNNTTHISVADVDGMVASISTSAGENAGFVVGNTGVMLNNMLGETDLHRNGFHRLPPGRRMMTMMSPTLVLHNNQPLLAVGSGGSNRLRSAILQVISNVLDFSLPLAAAVEAPRIHFEDNELQLEGGIGPAAAKRLESAGYKVNRWPERNMFFGGTHAVARQGPPGSNANPWVAAGDPRRGGSTLVIR
jgi:gamma-glutamyltranspeptidase/glutathione hydrolase